MGHLGILPTDCPSFYYLYILFFLPTPSTPHIFHLYGYVGGACSVLSPQSLPWGETDRAPGSTLELWVLCVNFNAQGHCHLSSQFMRGGTAPSDHDPGVDHLLHSGYSGAQGFSCGFSGGSVGIVPPLYPGSHPAVFRGVLQRGGVPVGCGFLWLGYSLGFGRTRGGPCIFQVFETPWVGSWGWYTGGGKSENKMKIKMEKSPNNFSGHVMAGGMTNNMCSLKFSSRGRNDFLGASAGDDISSSSSQKGCYVDKLVRAVQGGRCGV